MRPSRDHVESRFKCDGIFNILFSVWIVSGENTNLCTEIEVESLQISAIRKNDKYQGSVCVVVLWFF